MSWKSELPTKPGYYWVRFGEEDTEPSIVEVVRLDELEVFCFGADDAVPLEQFAHGDSAVAPAQWIGPLAPGEAAAGLRTPSQGHVAKTAA